MVGVSKAKDYVPDHSKLEEQKKKDIALVMLRSQTSNRHLGLGELKNRQQ